MSKPLLFTPPADLLGDPSKRTFELYQSDFEGIEKLAEATQAAIRFIAHWRNCLGLPHWVYDPNETEFTELSFGGLSATVANPDVLYCLHWFHTMIFHLMEWCSDHPKRFAVVNHPAKGAHMGGDFLSHFHLPWEDVQRKGRFVAIPPPGYVTCGGYAGECDDARDGYDDSPTGLQWTGHPAVLYLDHADRKKLEALEKWSFASDTGEGVSCWVSWPGNPCPKVVQRCRQHGGDPRDNDGCIMLIPKHALRRGAAYTISLDLRFAGDDDPVHVEWTWHVEPPWVFPAVPACSPFPKSLRYILSRLQVNARDAGDPYTIELAPGVYDQSLGVSPWVSLRVPLVIRGTGGRPEDTVLDLQGTVVANEELVVLENLELRGTVFSCRTEKRGVVEEGAVVTQGTSVTTVERSAGGLPLKHLATAEEAQRVEIGAGEYTVGTQWVKCNAVIEGAGAGVTTIRVDKAVGDGCTGWLVVGEGRRVVVRNLTVQGSEGVQTFFQWANTTLVLDDVEVLGGHLFSASGEGTQVYLNNLATPTAATGYCEKGMVSATTPIPAVTVNVAIAPLESPFGWRPLFPHEVSHRAGGSHAPFGLDEELQDNDEAATAEDPRAVNSTPRQDTPPQPNKSAGEKGGKGSTTNAPPDSQPGDKGRAAVVGGGPRAEKKEGCCAIT